MPVLIARRFGTLKAVTHKDPEIVRNWRDDLVGLSGFIDVLEAPDDQQYIVCELYGFLHSIRVTTTPGTVEIVDDRHRLTANTRNTIYEFDIVNKELEQQSEKSER